MKVVVHFSLERRIKVDGRVLEFPDYGGTLVVEVPERGFSKPLSFAYVNRGHAIDLSIKHRERDIVSIKNRADVGSITRRLSHFERVVVGIALTAFPEIEPDMELEYQAAGTRSSIFSPQPVFN